MSTKKEKVRAKYKCLKCEATWKDKPGPTPCPNCKHKYVKWMNYETLKEKGKI